MQALVLLTDHKMCSIRHRDRFEEEVKKVKQMGVNIVPVGIGRNIDIQELGRVRSDGHKIIIMDFRGDASHKTIGNSILHSMFIVEACFCIKAKIATIAEKV